MNIYEVIADTIRAMLEPLLYFFGGDPRVQAVRERVAEMCGFLPTVTSVSAMLAAANPTVTGVIGIATAICQAVTTSSAMNFALSSTLGTVNGVPIEGDWIKGK